MKKLWRAVSVVVTILLAGYFVWFAASRLDLARAWIVLRDPVVLVATLLAAASHALIYPLTGAAWSVLLRRQSIRQSVGSLTQLIGFTQIFRYIPGNIAQHASRALLGTRRGIPARAYFVTVIQETGLTICASLLVGASMLAWSSHSLTRQDLEATDLVYGAAVIAGICVVLSCLDFAPAENGRIGPWPRLVAWIGGTPGLEATLRSMACYAGNYLAVGLGFWIIARALGLGQEIGFAFATAVFSLSWVLGFLVPGAPAGLGAREGLLLLLLHGHGADDRVILLTLLARVASMIGDVLVFLAALYFAPADGRSSGESV